MTIAKLGAIASLTWSGGCGPDRMAPGEPPQACDPPASSRLGLNAYHLVRAELGTAEGDVEAALDEARLVGAGALRVWLFDHPRPPRWHAASERVLDAIDAAGLRTVATLSNLWPDYGGVGGLAADLPKFFADEGLESAWRSEVEPVVRRGRDRPGILAWELMNEPRCPRCDPGVVRRWLDRQRRFVRSIDPDTPIWDGDEGWAAGDGWGVDSAGSLHTYPRTEASGGAAQAVAQGRRRIAQAGRRARQAGVSWVLGEIGWPYQGCPAADPDCSRAEAHLAYNDAEKALALGTFAEEAWRQGADWVFLWRLAEPAARDWDHLAITPSMMPRTQAALCEAAHLLADGSLLPGGTSDRSRLGTAAP